MKFRFEIPFSGEEEKKIGDANRLESLETSKSPEKKQEVPELSLKNYIDKNSRILVTPDKIGGELKKLYEPLKGHMSYSDSKEIKFNVEGYDFIYFDEYGNLRHTKIIPDIAPNLEKADRSGERKDLEDKLEKAGFQLDDSEDLRSAIWRQLNG